MNEPNEELTPEELIGYTSWRIEYEAQQKIDKRNHLFAIVVAVTIVGLIGLFLYLWFTDELKFVLHDTDHVTAVVSEIKWVPVSGGFIQHVTYKFQFNGKDYLGYFKGTKITGKHKVGDFVKVKFATDDPSISKRVATLKRKAESNHH